MEEWGGERYGGKGGGGKGWRKVGEGGKEIVGLEKRKMGRIVQF